MPRILWLRVELTIKYSLIVEDIVYLLVFEIFPLYLLKLLQIGVSDNKSGGCLPNHLRWGRHHGRGLMHFDNSCALLPLGVEGGWLIITRFLKGVCEVARLSGTLSHGDNEPSNNLVIDTGVINVLGNYEDLPEAS